jgi:hypothetical protein
MQTPSYQTPDESLTVTNTPDSAQETPMLPTVSPQAVQSAQDAPTPASESALRSAREIRRRPIARYIGIGIVAVVGAILVGVGVFSVNRAQRTIPIELQAYPNAKVTSEKRQNNTDEIRYSSADTPDKLNEWYTKQLNTTDPEQGCKRLFTKYNANPQGGDPIPSLAPDGSYYRCILDNSFLDVVQSASVTITYDPATKGSRVILTRSWGTP